MKNSRENSKKINANIFVVLFLIFSSSISYAQIISSAKFGKGLKLMTADSGMLIHFTTRFQTLYEAEQSIKDGKLNNDFEDGMMIRRARFKFDGYVLAKKLKYKMEMAFAAKDMGVKQSEADKHYSGGQSYILDAVIQWNFYKKAELWFGQTKLPGNRERVVSSQQLQFVDRSLVNNYFNLDRDLGIQIHNKGSIGGIVIREAIAVTMGEGRNVTSLDNGGKSYTGRIDILPLGEFKDKGDFVGSDLSREQKPKLLIGGSYNLNQRARRSAGQLGGFIADTLSGDFAVVEVDMTLKYKGLSIMAEYADRSIVTRPSSKYFIGNGVTAQLGYLLKSNIEFAGRYTQINPSSSNAITEYTLGVSKYIVGHSLKIQSDASYSETQNSTTKGLRYRFQVEFQF